MDKKLSAIVLIAALATTLGGVFGASETGLLNFSNSNVSIDSSNATITNSTVVLGVNDTVIFPDSSPLTANLTDTSGTNDLSQSNIENVSNSQPVIPPIPITNFTQAIYPTSTDLTIQPTQYLNQSIFFYVYSNVLETNQIQEANGLQSELQAAFNFSYPSANVQWVAITTPQYYYAVLITYTPGFSQADLININSYVLPSVFN